MANIPTWTKTIRLTIQKFTIEWQKIDDGRLVRMIEMMGDRGSMRPSHKSHL